MVFNGYNRVVFPGRLMARFGHWPGEVSSVRIKANETDRTFMYHLYVLSSINYQKSYIGVTDNIDRRIAEHNSGKMAFTRRYIPWEIIHTENFGTLKEARRKESFYKSSLGRRHLKKLFK